MFFDSLLRERVGLSIPNMNEGVMLDNSYYNVPPFPSDDDVFSLQSDSPDSYTHQHDDDDDESNSCKIFPKKCNEYNASTETLLEHQNESLEEEYECIEEVKEPTSSHVANINVLESDKQAKISIEHCRNIEPEKLAEESCQKNDSNFNNVVPKSSSDNNSNANMEKLSKPNKRTVVNSNAYHDQIQSRNHEYTNGRYNINSSNTIQDDHNVVIVSHGLLIRLFISRWYRLPTEVFETMCNPPNCSIIVMERNDNIGRMVMTDISKELFGSDPLLQMIRFDGVEDAEWHKHQLQSILNPDQYAFDRPAEDDDENHYSKSAAHNTTVGAPAPPRRVTHSRTVHLRDGNIDKNESRTPTSDQEKHTLEERSQIRESHEEEESLEEK